MNKEKLKHLPFNLIFCVSSFILPFIFVSVFLTVDTHIAYIIAFYIYLNDVRISSQSDYLEEKIKQLETNK